ncbi:MAG: translation elongation factor Ts [Proteobacteria bacterium]|nr:translation elongation factor Ts [Pseudomonadota bacterium]MDA1301373.1 translation elongation factor Ts [Pseudomonadota bacterium]
MAAISASMVKELRERTQLGMMDCKKALVEADGDMELAIENMRKSSGLKAAKKAGRIASDGLIGIRLTDDGRFGVMVEVNCETDFAARDDNFVGFVGTVTDQIFESRESDIDKLLEAGLEGTRESLVQKIGENVSIRRAEVFGDQDDQGHVHSYVHNNGKIGVLVAMTGGSAELGKDIAMHIAATSPLVVGPDDAPADVIEKEREIYKAQADDSGKPPEIVAKMIEGKVRKYLAEISLTEQPFVKDGEIKVGALLKREQASVIRFARYEVGEGIEKATEDFAAEVAAQLT